MSKSRLVTHIVAKSALPDFAQQPRFQRLDFYTRDTTDTAEPLYRCNHTPQQAVTERQLDKFIKQGKVLSLAQPVDLKPEQDTGLYLAKDGRVWLAEGSAEQFDATLRPTETVYRRLSAHAAYNLPL